MKITDNKNKISRISSLHYAPVSDVQIVDYPGQYAKCSGNFTEISFSEATFDELEPDNGSAVEQNIDILLRGQSEESDIECTDIAGKYLLLKIGYTNGKTKLVGTPDNPVLLSTQTGGSQVETKLTCKRFSAEKAKYIVS